MKHVACRRDAHWEAARSGFLRCFRHPASVVGAPPKVERNVRSGAEAALIERLLPTSTFVRQKKTKSSRVAAGYPNGTRSADIQRQKPGYGQAMTTRSIAGTASSHNQA